MMSRSSVCVVVKVELEMWPPSRSVGRGRHCLGYGLAATGAGNWSQAFTTSMLTVLRLISSTVALTAGSARVTGLGSSTSIVPNDSLVHTHFTKLCCVFDTLLSS